MRYKGIKGRIWEIIKQYVRDNETECYTCGATNLEGRNAQAGHYRTVATVGSNSRRAWMREIIHLQCSRCNGAGGGEQAKYRAHLVRDYGEDFVDAYDKSVDAKSYDAVKNWQEIVELWL